MNQTRKWNLNINKNRNANINKNRNININKNRNININKNRNININKNRNINVPRECGAQILEVGDCSSTYQESERDPTESCFLTRRTFFKKIIKIKNEVSDSVQHSR